MSSQKKILVIGSNGQIGTVLIKKLCEKYGYDNVIGSDIKHPDKQIKFIFEACSVLDKDKLEQIIDKYKITDVYLLAAYLSAKGEKNINQAWDLNINGLLNILNFAKEEKIKKFFGLVQLQYLAHPHLKLMSSSMIKQNLSLFTALVN